MSVIKLKPFLYQYVLFLSRLILLFLLLRIFEYMYIQLYLEKDLSLDLFFSRSVNFDVLSILIFSIGLLIPALLLKIIDQRVSIIFIKTFGLIFFLSNLIFTHYFLINSSLLTISLFDFSASELYSIVLNEFTLNRVVLMIAFFAFILLSVYLLLFKSKRQNVNGKIKNGVISLYFIAVIISLVNINHTFKSLKYFDNNYQYLVGNSKSVYFLRSLKNIKKYASSRKELKKSVNQFQSVFPDFNYSSRKYPLIHNEPYINVLGEYFSTSSTPPNIVLIISESLSTSFSGHQNSIGGSLTPFTDSLANHGLSWYNFTSNAERSYGVLPSVLGSLPSGNHSRGFVNMNNKYQNQNRYPDHITLIELLQENNYFTNYYYAGWGYFDNVGFYLKEKNIDNFFTSKKFNTDKYFKNDNIWGYDDKTLFNQSFDDMETFNSDKPYLNIYQTISNHSPFNIIDKEYAEASFIENRLKDLGLTGSDARKIPDKILSSVFFADDALKEFFIEYQKRDDFNNTIFIVTGDHGIPFNINDGVFEIYRVPLIIYSPLNTKTQNFKGISSHIDILPSLLALLEDNYNLNFPKSKHWLGVGLDTSKSFNANRFVPLNINSLEKPKFILNDQVLYNDRIFTLSEDFDITEQTNQQSINNVKNVFDAYLFINNFVCIENRIWQYD